jgi:thiol-disulfide isomerase/thioredoxin
MTLIRFLAQLPVCGLALLIQSAPIGAVDAGDVAPDFRAQALSGPRPLSLADYRGKVVYLDFWASWCAPCATALPILDGFGKEFSKDGFQVLAVNVDSDPAKARLFLERRPVGYPSVTDPEGKLPTKFGVETMPTSFLIDRNGVVRLVHRGFKKTDADTLRAEIRKLVGGR